MHPNIQITPSVDVGSWTVLWQHYCLWKNRSGSKFEPRPLLLSVLAVGKLRCRLQLCASRLKGIGEAEVRDVAMMVCWWESYVNAIKSLFEWIARRQVKRRESSTKRYNGYRRFACDVMSCQPYWAWWAVAITSNHSYVVYIEIINTFLSVG